MKKISYLFIALLTSMSIMTSCDKDDKDEATDNSAAAMEEFEKLKPEITENADNIVLTWAGKYYQATETISFADGVCTTAEYSGSIDCGGALYAQLVYESLTLVPDGTTYGVQGSKVTMTRSDNASYQGKSKAVILETLQLLCSKDDKDEAIDNTEAALNEIANLKPTISDNGDNIVLTWAGKYYQATETISFADGVATTAEYSGSIDCGGALYAQLAYESLTLVPDGTTYGVQGSKVTMTRTENTYSGSSKAVVLETLQLLYE